MAYLIKFLVSTLAYSTVFNFVFLILLFFVFLNTFLHYYFHQNWFAVKIVLLLLLITNILIILYLSFIFKIACNFYHYDDIYHYGVFEISIALILTAILFTINNWALFYCDFFLYLLGVFFKLYFLWKFLSFWTAVWLLFIFCLVLESLKLFYSSDKRFKVYFLKPIPVTLCWDGYTAARIVYVIICNFIFESIYKLNQKKFIVINYYTFWYLLLNFSLGIFGLNRIFFKILKYLILRDNFKTLEEFLLFTFTNFLDNRKIVRRGLQLINNPKDYEILNKIYNNCKNIPKGLLDSGSSIIKNGIEEIRSFNFHEKTIVQQCVFTKAWVDLHRLHRVAKIPHLTYQDIYFGQQYGAYLTDQARALKGDFIKKQGLDLVTQNIKGSHKTSCIVATKSKILESISKDVYVSIAPVLESVQLVEYSRSLFVDLNTEINKQTLPKQSSLFYKQKKNYILKLQNDGFSEEQANQIFMAEMVKLRFNAQFYWLEKQKNDLLLKLQDRGFSEQESKQIYIEINKQCIDPINPNTPFKD